MQTEYKNKAIIIIIPLTQIKGKSKIYTFINNKKKIIIIILIIICERNTR
jgi:hypothetical protein